VKGPHPIPWPTREEFLAWGLKLCPGCRRKLINPSVLSVCLACEQREQARSRKRERKKRRRSAAKQFGSVRGGRW
jgi:hypothetical protein